MFIGAACSALRCRPRKTANPLPRRSSSTFHHRPCFSNYKRSTIERRLGDQYIDLRGEFAACGDDRACEPLPVERWVRTDFLWQRSPFLLLGGSRGTIEGAGIDFLLPYWMARYYGVL